MPQPQLLTATRILERTMPATTRRLLVYGTVTLAYLLSILLGAGTFYGLASFAKNPSFWGQLGAIVGLSTCLYAICQIRPTLFHRVDLIHLAAMVKRLTGQELPSGREQLEQLDAYLPKLFPSGQESFACYLKIRRFVLEASSNLPPTNQLSRLPQPLAAWLPQGLTTAILGPCTQAILALAIQAGRLTDLRRSAVVLCEHYQAIFRHALILSAFLYGLSLVAFWLFLKPVEWVDAALPLELGLWQYVFALILTYWIKAAFLDPIVVAAMTIALLQLKEQTSLSEEIMQQWHLKLPSLAQLPD